MEAKEAFEVADVVDVYALGLEPVLEPSNLLLRPAVEADSTDVAA